MKKEYNNQDLILGRRKEEEEEEYQKLGLDDFGNAFLCDFST